MPSSKRLPLLPAFLTLAVLVAAPPAPADTPAPPAATSQTITLQHVLPADLLQSLHWDHAAALPEGVTRITALPASNALSVIATPDGLAQVREIVALADVAPRQVKIEFALAALSEAQLKAFGLPFDHIPAGHIPAGHIPAGHIPAAGGPPKTQTRYASGPAVASLRKKLQAQGAILQAPIISTVANADASFTLTGDMPLPGIQSVTLAATPRVGDDGSVTLNLHPWVTWRVNGKDMTEGLQAQRTVRDGETLMYTGLFADAVGPNKRLVLFARPTVLTAKQQTP